MHYVFIVIILLLIGCTPQETIPKHEDWSFVYFDGTTLQFPDAWYLIHYSGSMFNGIYLTDTYGEFYVFQDVRSHRAMEEIYIADSTLIELVFDENIRLFRGETTMEFEDDVFRGATEFIEYVAFVPNDKVLRAWIPITSQLEEQETILQDVFRSAHPLQPDLNTFGFLGGLAVMVYPDDWEIVNWNMSDSPVLQKNNVRLSFVVRDESFHHNWIDDEDGNITTEDVINYLLERDFDVKLSEVESSYRYGQLLYRYENRFLLVVDNELIFNISAYDINGEQLENVDEEQILQMVDSILLNNRSNYYEAIDLIVPEGMGE